MARLSALRLLAALVVVVVLVRVVRDRSPEALAPCAAAASCAVCAARHAVDGCAWCASERRCAAAGERCADGDVEAGVCSGVFLAGLRPAARVRVISVSKRSGGPEALVQLYLALRHWGYNATLESRRAQVGGKLLPFFARVYASEFARVDGGGPPRVPRHRDYRAFLDSAAPGDVFVLTETWPCRRGLSAAERGAPARQVTYHLTAQDRRLTYDIAHVYLPRGTYDPEACAALAHTHFIAGAYLNISPAAVARPYVSPHIVARADARGRAGAAARDVVLFDGDAGFDVAALAERHRAVAVKAAGLRPEALYALYERALAVVDFGMPGVERLVLEGALFGAAAIIDDALNGASAEDFPVPARFRVAARNYSAVDALLDEVQGDWARVSREFAPFAAFVRGLRGSFLREVRQYFDGASLRVVVDCGGAPEGGTAAEAAPVVAALLHVPLATVTVLPSCARATASAAFRRFLGAHYLSASVEFAAEPQRRAEERVVAVVRGGACVASPEFLRAAAAELALRGGRPFALLGGAVRVGGSHAAALRAAGEGGVVRAVVARTVAASAAGVAGGGAALWRQFEGESGGW